MEYPKDYPESLKKNFQMIYFTDIETSGLDAWKNEIITLSMSACDLKSKTQIDEIEIQMRPETPQTWQVDAEKIHGISKEKALSFPSREEGRKKLLSFLDFYKVETPQLICCHALSFKGSGLFDWNFIRREFDKVNMNYELDKYFYDVHSTIDFAKEIQKHRGITFINNKLNTIAQHFDIELNHHDAKSDRMACQEIYWRFLDL